MTMTAAAMGAGTADGQGQTASPATTAVAVQASASHALRASPLSNFASLFGPNNQPLKSFSPRDDASLDVVAGTTADGQEVVAFVPPGAGSGSKVMVPQNLMMPRPPSISREDACLIPYLALGVLPALMQLGLHEQGGRAQQQDGGAPACVVTGCGLQAQFVTQVLAKCWQHRVAVCTRRNGPQMKTLGAVQVIDYTKESFSDVLMRNRTLVVVDTVGVDADGLSSALQKMTGAGYVSSMASSTRTMQEEGVFKGGNLFASMFGGKPATPQTKGYILPERRGMEVVEYALSMVAAGKVELVGRAPDMNDYMDAIMWPKDSESGYRFGFPTTSSSPFESLGSASSDDSNLLNAYTRAMADQEEKSELENVFEFFGDGVLQIMGESTATGNRGNTPTVLFVSAPSCEVCRQLKPKVAQLAQEFNSVRFLNLSADPGNHKIVMFLRVPRYPFFICYRDGKRTFEHGALDLTLIKEIFMMSKGVK